MTDPEPIGDILKRIFKEMAETIAKAGGATAPIELRDEPPGPTGRPKPRLRLLKGGKEAPCGGSSPD